MNPGTSFALSRETKLRYSFDPLAQAQTWLDRWNLAPPDELAHEEEDRRTKLTYLQTLPSPEPSCT